MTNQIILNFCSNELGSRLYGAGVSVAEDNIENTLQQTVILFLFCINVDLLTRTGRLLSVPHCTFSVSRYTVSGARVAYVPVTMVTRVLHTLSVFMRCSTGGEASIRNQWRVLTRHLYRWQRCLKTFIHIMLHALLNKPAYRLLSIYGVDASIPCPQEEKY